VDAGLALAGGGTSLTGVRQTLQTAAFCALSTAAFSLATTSLSCGTDHAHYMKFKLAVIGSLYLSLKPKFETLV